FFLDENKGLENIQKVDYYKKIVLPSKNEIENYKLFMKKTMKKST